MAEMRRCIGSARFGIEPHLAPIDDFPKQPSQRDGLGRMCRTHWNAYTKALAAAARDRKTAAEAEATEAEATEEPSVTVVAVSEETEATPAEAIVTPVAVTAPTTKRSRRTKTPAPIVEGEEAAG